MLATAVTLTFANAWRVDAAPGASESTVVTVEPTRVLDTRVDVGLTGKIVGNTPRKLLVTGNIDTWIDATETLINKEVVPAGATGVLMNVTAVSPTGVGFLSVRPGDATGIPATASLTFTPDDIVPNAVTVALPATRTHAGQIDLYYGTAAGNRMDVVIDIVGYTTNTGLTDLTNRLVAAEAKIDVLETAQPFSVTEVETGARQLTGTPESYVSVTVTAPAAGHVTLNSTANVGHSVDGGDIACAIFEDNVIPVNSIPAETPGFQAWETGGFSNEGVLSGTRGFGIAAGATTYTLACHELSGGGGSIDTRNLTAIFTPAP